MNRAFGAAWVLRPLLSPTLSGHGLAVPARRHLAHLVHRSTHPALRHPHACEPLWGESAVNTWNARRASVLSWLGWCTERGYGGPAVPAWVKRLPPPDSETPARSKMAVDRLIKGRTRGQVFGTLPRSPRPGKVIALAPGDSRR